MAFSLFNKPPDKHNLLEIYDVREKDGLMITECKLLLEGKLISFGLARSDIKGFRAHVGRKLALGEAAKIFFKSQYNLTIKYAETDDISI